MKNRLHQRQKRKPIELPLSCSLEKMEGEQPMKHQIIESIVQQMLAHLDNMQLKRLQNVLEHELFDCEIREQEECSEDDSKRLLELFITH